MDTVTRMKKVTVLRCEAKTKPQWYRPQGGRCPYEAVVQLDGEHLCRSHAIRWARNEDQASLASAEEEK